MPTQHLGTLFSHEIHVASFSTQEAAPSSTQQKTAFSARKAVHVSTHKRAHFPSYTCTYFFLLHVPCFTRFNQDSTQVQALVRQGFSCNSSRPHVTNFIHDKKNKTVTINTCNSITLKTCGILPYLFLATFSKGKLNEFTFPYGSRTAGFVCRSRT